MLVVFHFPKENVLKEYSTLPIFNDLASLLFIWKWWDFPHERNIMIDTWEMSRKPIVYTLFYRVGVRINDRSIDVQFVLLFFFSKSSIRFLTVQNINNKSCLSVLQPHLHSYLSTISCWFIFIVGQKSPKSHEINQFHGFFYIFLLSDSKFLIT